MGGSRVASDGHTGNIHVRLQQNKARNAEEKGDEELSTGDWDREVSHMHNPAK